MTDKKDAALKLALEALKKDTRFYKAEKLAAITAIREALAEQPAQEPVAWMGAHDNTDLYYRKPPQGDVVPLYTAPQPSKPWVGLTEEDRSDIWKKSSSIDGAINATATKLREKNAAPCKPLTDEQIAELMMQTWGCASIAPRHAPAFARAIEQAHGIKEST